MFSISPFKPTQDEIKRLCSSNQFRKCARLKAFNEYLNTLVGKEGAWLVDPDLFPRHLLLTRARQLARALSPREEHQAEFAYHVDKLLFDQIRSTYRENFVTEISFEKMKFGSEGLAVKADVVWNYEMHNITDSPVDYLIPMSARTHSFVNEGLPIEDHVVIREITTSIGDSGDWKDLVKKYKLGSIPVQQSSGTKVELVLTGKAAVTIPPNDFARICLKFFYVAELRDDHTQRMLTLTRNFELQLNYSEEDFFVDIDDFCLPIKKSAVIGRHYHWKGWLLPFHGVIIEWTPIWLFPSLYKTLMKEKMRA